MNTKERIAEIVDKLESAILCIEHHDNVGEDRNFAFHKRQQLKVESTDQLLGLFLSENAGKELYMDLAGRLIKRILEFNPDLIYSVTVRPLSNIEHLTNDLLVDMVDSLGLNFCSLKLIVFLRI